MQEYAPNVKLMTLSIYTAFGVSQTPKMQETRKGASVMNEYIILKANVEGYDRLVLCLSFESLLSYIDKIEYALSLDKKEKRILIDQLFITGNGTNRFMSCEFSNGKIDFKTAQIVDPDEYYRKETADWLHDNYSYVENSILTDEQRQKIKNKVAF